MHTPKLLLLVSGRISWYVPSLAVGDTLCKAGSFAPLHQISVRAYAHNLSKAPKQNCMSDPCRWS